MSTKLTGTANADTLTGSTGDDLIDGLAGDDSLSGGAGNDTLYGGAGGDTLDGGAGNDLLDGGAVLDRVDYSDVNMVSYRSSPAAVDVNLATGLAQDGFGTTDTLVNIIGVLGSDFADKLTGSAASAEFLQGHLGNDTIDGGAISGRGLTSNMGFGDSNIAGYRLATGAVTVDLNAGTATGADGNDTLININGVLGSDFADKLLGSNSTTLIELFDGDKGNDTIDGRGGFDLVTYDNTSAAVKVNLATGIASDGNGGTDTLLNIEGVKGSDFNDSLTGGTGDDWLEGRSGNDTLTGGAGNDTLLGGLGNDRFYGGAGSDLIDGGEQRSVPWAVTTGDYDTLDGFGNNGITVNLGARTVAVAGEIGVDSYSGIEEIDGSSASDKITGRTSTSAADAASGTNLYLYLRGGSDLVDITAYGVQQPWADGVYVGYHWSLSPINLVYKGATATVSYQATGTQLAGQDSLTNVGLFGDTAYNDLFDLRLATGNQLGYITNPLRGVNYNTLLLGRGGSDTVYGNGDTGVHYGGVTTSTNGLGLTIDLMTGSADLSNLLNGSVALGTLTFSGLRAITGTKFADTMRGGVNDDFETFRGDAGNDFIDGRSGWDRADYRNATEGVQILLRQGQASSTSQGTDTLRSIEEVRGSMFADVYDARGFDGGYTSETFNVGSGWSGSNQFNGEGGNDTIYGNGSTRVSYDTAMVAVQVDLQAGVADARIESDKLTNQYKTVGRDTFTGVYQVRGSALDDVLLGGGAGRTSTGLAIEAFIGGAGNDSIDGRGGYDIVFYGASPAGITVDLRLANGQVQDGWGFVDTLANIEEVGGSMYADTMIGDAGNNNFVGLRGADRFDGGAGSSNEIGYANDLAGVTVRLGGWVGATGPLPTGYLGSAIDGWGDIDLFSNIQGAEGSNFNDLIVGNAADNRLDGRGGNDTIDGGAGSDWVEYNQALIGIRVDLSQGKAFDDGQGVGDALQSAAVESDTLISIENVQGGYGNDLIIGDLGANQLEGGAGNDTLYGGAGNDVAIFSGKRDQYTVTATTSGWQVQDLRAAPQFNASTGSWSANDGTDLISEIETLRFADVDMVVAKASTQAAFVELQHLTLKQNAVSGTTSVRFDIAFEASTIDGAKIAAGEIDLVYDYSKVAAATAASTSFGADKAAVWSVLIANLSGASANGKIAVVADNDPVNPIVDANGKVLTVSLTVTGLVSSFDIGLESGKLGGSTTIKTADNVSHAVTVGASKTAANNAPVALSLDVATDQGVAKSGLLSATDADGNPLSFAKLTGPAHGTVTIDAATGAYSYAPSPRYIGADSFSFISNDGLVDSVPATVNISVTDTVNTQFQAYSWKTHALLDNVQVGAAGSSALHNTGSNGAVSFSAKAGLGTALNAQRPIPTAEADDTGQAVNLQDAIAILKMIVGLDVNGTGKPLSPYQAYAADFDANGAVDLGDAISVLKHVVGLPSADPQWLFFNESDRQLAGLNPLKPGTGAAISADLSGTGPIHVGLVGVLRGDVDGSYAGPAQAQNLGLAYFEALAIDKGLNLSQFGVYGP